MAEINITLPDNIYVADKEKQLLLNLAERESNRAEH